jgi:hypothetical protein
MHRLRWSREKLLHQAFLVGLESFQLLGFGGDQGVEAAQARGDALLFGGRGSRVELFAEILLQRGAIGDVGAVFVFEVLECAEKSGFYAVLPED